MVGRSSTTPLSTRSFFPTTSTKRRTSPALTRISHLRILKRPNLRIRLDAGATEGPTNFDWASGSQTSHSYCLYVILSTLRDSQALETGWSDTTDGSRSRSIGHAILARQYLAQLNAYHEACSVCVAADRCRH